MAREVPNGTDHDKDDGLQAEPASGFYFAALKQSLLSDEVDLRDHQRQVSFNRDFDKEEWSGDRDELPDYQATLDWPYGTPDELFIDCEEAFYGGVHVAFATAEAVLAQRERQWLFCADCLEQLGTSRHFPLYPAGEIGILLGIRDVKREVQAAAQCEPQRRRWHLTMAKKHADAIVGAIGELLDEERGRTESDA